MRDHPVLAYNRLAIEANRLARRMRLLHDHVTMDMGAVLDDLYDGELAEMHDRLCGIGAVLTLIRQTPKASINAEGMATIRDEVEAAAKIEQSDWARAIFDELDPSF